MDLAEDALGLLGGAGHAGPVGDVDLDQVQVVGAGVLGGDLVEVLLQQVGDHHLHARVQERLGHAIADAAGAAGDEGDLPFHVTHGRFPFERRAGDAYLTSSNY